MTDRRSATGGNDAKRTLRAANRASSAVVGKALEAGIVVLYVGLLTSTLYAGAIPEYRSAAGQEIADRAVADASADLRATVPANATAVNATARVDLPATIRGEEYSIRVDGARLVLEHPHPAVDSQTPLVLPDAVASVDGHWESREPALVRVRGDGHEIDVRLVRGRS